MPSLRGSVLLFLVFSLPSHLRLKRLCFLVLQVILEPQVNQNVHEEAPLFIRLLPLEILIQVTLANDQRRQQHQSGVEEKDFMDSFIHSSNLVIQTVLGSYYLPIIKFMLVFTINTQNYTFAGNGLFSPWVTNLLPVLYSSQLRSFWRTQQHIAHLFQQTIQCLG